MKKLSLLLTGLFFFTSIIARAEFPFRNAEEVATFLKARTTFEPKDLRATAKNVMELNLYPSDTQLIIEVGNRVFGKEVNQKLPAILEIKTRDTSRTGENVLEFLCQRHDALELEKEFARTAKRTGQTAFIKSDATVNEANEEVELNLAVERLGTGLMKTDPGRDLVEEIRAGLASKNEETFKSASRKARRLCRLLRVVESDTTVLVREAKLSSEMKTRKLYEAQAAVEFFVSMAKDENQAVRREKEMVDYLSGKGLSPARAGDAITGLYLVMKEQYERTLKSAPKEDEHK